MIWDAVIRFLFIGHLWPVWANIIFRDIWSIRAHRKASGELESKLPHPQKKTTSYQMSYDTYIEAL